MDASSPIGQLSVQSPDRWIAVQRVLEEFAEHAGASCPRLVIHAGSSGRWTNSEFKRRWPAFSQRRGIYLIFADDDDSLLYVGLAVGTWLDKRVWTHDTKRVMHVTGRIRGWTDVIPFETCDLHLVSHLERLLIERLAPPCNVANPGFDAQRLRSDVLMYRPST